MSAKPNSVLSRIVREHALQAFSPRYFVDHPNQSLFSYSDEQCRNAELLVHSAGSASPLFTEPLAPPEDTWRTVDLSQLTRFFANPTQYLLRERLGIQLLNRTDQLQEREPFELDNLERYLQRNRLLGERLLGHGSDQSAECLSERERASGWLPHGALGSLLLDDYQNEVEQFATRLTEQPIEFVPAIEVDLVLGPFRLTGWLRNIDAARGALFYRMGGLSGKEVITLLLSHLTLNALGSECVSAVSEYVTPEASLKLSPCDRAAQTLTGLLDLYWRGLCEPLPFFPKSSYQYAEACWADKDGAAAARKSWFGNENYGLGECDNAYYQLAFADRDPLDETFETLAQDVFALIPDLKS